MAHSFGATNVGFGTLSGWSIVSGDADDNFQRAEAMGPTGNEVASNLYDEKNEVTTSYQANSTDAPSIPATLGAGLNNITLLSIKIDTTADGFATMTLTGHRHLGSNTHGTVRTASHGISLSSGFGTSLFGAAVTETNGCFSSSCSIECQHQDVISGNGLNIAGENYDGKITIEITAVGTIASAPSGYDTVSTKTANANTDFLRTTGTYVKALSMA